MFLARENSLVWLAQRSQPFAASWKPNADISCNQFVPEVAFFSFFITCEGLHCSLAHNIKQESCFLVQHLKVGVWKPGGGGGEKEEGEEPSDKASNWDSGGTGPERNPHA